MAGGLDHLVIVARDLDALGGLYSKLGFQVGAQNRHDWGTLNRIVQFDGVFLELLTTEEGFQRPETGTPVYQFSDTIVDYLERREGLAMMVLEGHDTAADHAAFNANGIGMPETFCSLISSCARRTGSAGERVTGSSITPCSERFTLATSILWASTERFL